MKVFCYISLVYLVIEGGFRLEVLGCKGNGFTNLCECNFMGACSLDGKALPRLNLTKVTPKGVDQFAYKITGNKALTYLCEGRTVAILYDCNARIPLYAATVMTGDQLEKSYRRPGYHFQVSDNLAEEFQQQDDDYKHSKDRNICYETTSGTKAKFYVDTQWLRSHPHGTSIYGQRKCIGHFNLKSPVHRGHLIAASYGRGNNDRTRATFKYTNSVPQFGDFNSVAWNTCEKQLRQWALNNCFGDKTDSKTVRLHIVTGAIPSTFPSLSQRFFGRAGFSDFEGISNLPDTYGKNTGGPWTTPYRVNVPSFMWTAACCTFKDKNELETRSTAFYRENEPGNAPCKTSLPAAASGLNQLFSFLKGRTKPIDIFPKSSCNKNFVELTM